MENQVVKVSFKKSDRFESIEAYKESASKTAQTVAWNRKENAILRYYGFGKSFESYLLPSEDLYFDWEKRREFYLNDCNCPISLMYEYLQAIQYEEQDYTTFGLIARVIGKTTPASFERFGDKNCYTKDIKRNYISNEGIGLDVQAQGIELDFNISVSECDFIEFILAYPKGRASYETYTYPIQLAQKFKDMVGFSLDERFGREFLNKMTDKVEVVKEDCPF